MTRRTVYSIGFTKRSAQDFFETLKREGIQRLIDVRLNNASQLAGFSRSDSLSYLLPVVCAAEYRHEPLLAPTRELLTAYRKRRISWHAYARRFKALMRERRIEHELDPALFDQPTVLLCSEKTAECCHRRLVLDYLQKEWGGLQVRHL